MCRNTPSARNQSEQNCAVFADVLIVKALARLCAPVCALRIAIVFLGKIIYNLRVMGNRLRNTKQERFAREIAALTPLAVAYGMAGYGGAPEWHPYNASKLANKPHVKARIDELRAEFEKESAIKVEHVRHQLLRIVEAAPRALYERDPDDETGKRLRLRRIDELPTHVALAVANIKLDPESGEPVEVKLADKVPAAATLLRSLPGGAVERREVTVKGSDLLDPENLAKLDDDEIEALRRIASKIAGTDADSAGSPVTG
jgi:Terminase small subunit